jgi:hypothetical protein
MDLLKLLQRFLFILFFAWSGQLVMGQELRVTGQELLIKGTVYDRSQAFGLPDVSVMGTSGAGTVTDSLGNYHIHLRVGDSIYFSYLGKFTARTPVREINTNQPFDMSLEVGVESLPAVFVRSKNYRMDSLETREEYRKIFDYQSGGLDNLSSSRGGRSMGVGVDFDMLLRPGQVRRTLAFQKRLLEEEQDKYIDHRFSPAIVRRVTGMESPVLDSFMRIYRPSYEFLQTMTTEYEFYKYISDCGKFYSENR